MEGKWRELLSSALFDDDAVEEEPSDTVRVS